METMYKIGDKMAKATKAIAAVSFVAVIIMMLLNVVDVFLTKVFKAPIVGTYEITQRLLMCAVFASFAYAQSTKSHINMTILIAMFPRAIRFIIFTLMSLISVAAAGAMTWAAFVQGGVALASHTTTEVLYIPLYPFYYIECVAMAAFTVALIYDTVLSAIAIFRDDVAEKIQSQWS